MTLSDRDWQLCCDQMIELTTPPRRQRALSARLTRNLYLHTFIRIIGSLLDSGQLLMSYSIADRGQLSRGYFFLPCRRLQDGTV
ncbi:hypothetical protein J6590_039758 [Homalodisca vitripennis]|nr:hypothetical protein J6590_039758 [Homalodisca vitripennis]